MTKELRRLLEDNCVAATVEAGGKIFRIEPEISVVFSGGAAEWKATAFNVLSDGKETVCKSFKNLLKTLRQSGEEIKIISAGDFKTYEEYLADERFKHIDMAGLLEKYLPIADEFSLTTLFNEYDAGHPYGIYKVGESEASEAEKGIEEYAKKAALRAYQGLSDGQRSKLPPFDKLYEEVKAEYRSYAAARGNFMEEHGGSVFFADEFAKGNAKYSKYGGLWHMYSAVDFEGTCLYTLEKMKNNAKTRPNDWELGIEYYAPLKSALKRVETGFVWHCTASGQLSKTLYFEINAESISWLKKLKNDYDMRRLEDLAFYRARRCVFSSCTHEEFHCDLSAEK